MPVAHPSRRQVIAAAAGLAGLSSVSCAAEAPSGAAGDKPADRPGSQRLSVEQLQKWESLGYGMFIHYGMSTFVGKELPSGKDPLATYAPDRLDVDQWVSVARDAGMKYAVLTTKHVAGHCLWPTKHTSYSVVNSPDKTDVVEKFVKACQKRGVLAGFYYCSWDNHNRFGSRTPSDAKTQWHGGYGNHMALEMRTATQPDAPLPWYTTSTYQEFQTKQITELLTQYGPIAETWIDIPGVLGRGYRTFLYQRVAEMQPGTVIMMNSGISDGAKYNADLCWPADLIAIERRVPPGTGHEKWRTIEGKKYYMPGEVCDPIGKEWFWVPGDLPRADDVLAKQFQDCRAGGVNFLLDVPPDKHGVIPDEHVQALMRLRKNAGI